MRLVGELCGSCGCCIDSHFHPCVYCSNNAEYCDCDEELDYSSKPPESFRCQCGNCEGYDKIHIDFASKNVRVDTPVVLHDAPVVDDSAFALSFSPEGSSLAALFRGDFVDARKLRRSWRMTYTSSIPAEAPASLPAPAISELDRFRRLLLLAKSLDSSMTMSCRVQSSHVQALGAFSLVMPMQLPWNHPWLCMEGRNVRVSKYIGNIVEKTKENIGT